MTPWSTRARISVSTSAAGRSFSTPRKVGTMQKVQVLLHPTDTETVLVATSSGVHKTTNGGTSWTRKLSGNIRDLKMRFEDALVGVTKQFEFVNEDGSMSNWQWDIDLEKVKEDLIIGSFTHNDKDWSKFDLVDRLQITNPILLLKPQHQASCIMIKKCQKTIDLVKEWYEISYENNYHYIVLHAGTDRDYLIGEGERLGLYIKNGYRKERILKAGEGGFSDIDLWILYKFIK